ncbi:MAG: 4-amino-4-deoxy-L-arabinose transferase-like glycosyltransferase [Gammaproteobacteria bacterium]
MALLDTSAILLIYWITTMLAGKSAGLIAATLYCFNFTQIFYARWGWHPSLLPFFSLLLTAALLKIIEEKHSYWILVLPLLALLGQLHFSAVVFLPLVVVFMILQIRNSTSLNFLFVSVILTFIVVAPLLVYELNTSFSNAKKLLSILSLATTVDTSSVRMWLLPMLQNLSEQAYWPFGFRAELFDYYPFRIFNLSLVGIATIYFFYSRINWKHRLMFLYLFCALPTLLYFFSGQKSHYYLLSWFPIIIMAVGILLARVRGRWFVLSGILLVWLVSTNLYAYKLYHEELNQDHYDSFLAGAAGSKKQVIETIRTHADGQQVDLLIISWAWNNNAPYVYLSSTLSLNLGRVRMLVASLDQESNTLPELHYIDLSKFGFIQAEPNVQRPTYIILEPSRLMIIPNSIRISINPSIELRYIDQPVDKVDYGAEYIRKS